MTEYKVGDRGMTRDGLEVRCTEFRYFRTYPLVWSRNDGVSYATKVNGRFRESGIDERDIIRLADDAKVEPEPTCDCESETFPCEVTIEPFCSTDCCTVTIEPFCSTDCCTQSPSTLRTRASFSSDEHVIGGVHLIATCSGGKVSLHIGDKELSESEAAAVLRTIETVMEQARRAKEVVG